jgi:hypothetical protein
MLGFRARCLVGRLARALTTDVISKLPNRSLFFYRIKANTFNRP